jgi:hypothetical protein
MKSSKMKILSALQAPVKRSSSNKPRFLTLTAMIFLCCLFGIRAIALQDKDVGSTKDGCDGHLAVTFAGKAGQVSVQAGHIHPPEQLPSLTREISWYCGGTRERSANDTPFNMVQITRKPNGAITWTFKLRAAAAAQNMVRVGDTKDACDRSQPVTVFNTELPMVVKAGEIKTADMAALTREFGWHCGTAGERSANPLPFNRLQLERAGNGAMQFVFYRTLSVTGVGIGDFIHDVPGTLQLPVEFPQLPAGFLKRQVSQFWDSHLPEIEAMVAERIPKGHPPGAQGTIQLEGNNPVILSPSSQLELRLQRLADPLTVKVVVHGNQVTIRFIPDSSKNTPVNVTATFDLELVMQFPREQKLTPNAQHIPTGLKLNMQGGANHTEILANDPGSALLEGFFKAEVRAQETHFDNTMQPVTDKLKQEIIDALEAALAPLFQNVPPGTTVPLYLDMDAAGDVRPCPAATLGPCHFPAASAPPSPPHVLGTKTDMCSQRTVWLWDAERGKFVPLLKGQQGQIVQVDDKRFEWFCGDDIAPDPSVSHEESASGPTGTTQIRASREGEGRTIHWEFLSWR